MDSWLKGTKTKGGRDYSGEKKMEGRDRT